MPINEYGTFIRFDQTRLLCKDCKITFWYRPDWIHPHLDITMPLYHKIVLELCAHQATPKIASNCGVSQDMIFSVLNDLIIDHPSQLPEALGIDEFSGDVYTGSEKKTKLLVNISDLSCLPERDPDERGRSSWIIDVLPDTSLAYLKSFFMENYTLEQRKAVRYFCCDMHGGFIQLARTVFPDAAICFDMFHIVKRLNKAINDTRLRVQRSFFDYKEGRRVFKDGMNEAGVPPSRLNICLWPSIAICKGGFIIYLGPPDYPRSPIIFIRSQGNDVCVFRFFPAFLIPAANQ